MVNKGELKKGIEDGKKKPFYIEIERSKNGNFLK